MTVIFSNEIMLKKVCQNDVDFSSIEIISHKVRQNDVDFYFLLIEITLNKVCRSDVDFSHIEFTLNKYAVMIAYRGKLLETLATKNKEEGETEKDYGKAHFDNKYECFKSGLTT